MTQHISCQIQNENGELIHDSKLNFASIKKYCNDKSHYQWLNTIDYYGDTTFNKLQLQFVILELERLHKNVDANTQRQIQELIIFINKVDLHQYLKFAGD